MEVVVYGKPGCKLCNAAKAKLNLLQISFSFVDLMNITKRWRKNGSVEAMSWYMVWDTLPVIRVDGEYMDYPKAMRLVKERLK